MNEMVTEYYIWLNTPHTPVLTAIHHAKLASHLMKRRGNLLLKHNRGGDHHPQL